jgi:hypothetical protein
MRVAEYHLVWGYRIHKALGCAILEGIKSIGSTEGCGRRLAPDHVMRLTLEYILYFTLYSGGLKLQLPHLISSNSSYGM